MNASARWRHMSYFWLTTDLLTQQFVSRLISKRLWPPRSPDLSTIDLFHCSHLNGRIYKTQWYTQEKLKASVETHIAQLTGVLPRVVS